MNFIKKFFQWLIVFVVVAGIFAACFYFLYQPTKAPVLGVSFSIPQARYLGFDSKKMFDDILTELKPQKIRLMAYWELIEPERGSYDFSAIDPLIKDAEGHADIILVLGHKQPRWPECHHPTWYADLSPAVQQGAVLSMLEASVNHFKQFPNISAWQIENEPFFEYGPECGKIPKGLFEQELALVKRLDPRPIVVTDSGEKGWWFPTITENSDVFGSTMYRQVYHDKKGKYISYPIPSFYYRVRAGMLVAFTHIRKVIGVELQAEPWYAGEVFTTPLSRQFELMNPQILRNNVAYAKQSGFTEHYLWGVEWWYWLKEKQNDSSMWNTAAQILQGK